MENKICEQCGKVFTPAKHQPYQKFCSRKCYSIFYKKYHQKWQKEHPEKIAKYHRRYYLKHKKEHNKYSREQRSRVRGYLKNMLGNTCAICGKDLTNSEYGSFAIHEITGKRHSTHNAAMLKNKENLRLLCHKGVRGCHSFCHVLLDLGYSFEDAQKIYEFLKEGLPTVEEEAQTYDAF